MAPRNDILRGGNALKLALFGANCSSGRSYITAPERWVASWDNNVALARLAESVGLEAMIPIARWKGYGGETNPNGASWESLTWACGLLAATHRINVFATLHVPLNHPVIAAKQMVTADHIGQGRFGVNVVCGWNEDEFQMFGVQLEGHHDRYAQGEEWWSIIQRIWQGAGPFDFEGAYYQLHGVESAPPPYGGLAPTMMNAGSSAAGRTFALRFSDMAFHNVKTVEESVPDLAEARRVARALGREVQHWTPLGVVCRPTQRQADDAMASIVAQADPGAVGHLTQLYARDPRAGTGTGKDGGEFRQYGQGPVERRVLARGSYSVIGDPDHVADEIARLHAAGLDGLAVNFVNYLDELPYFAQEVLPRLERQGLRQKAPSPAL